MLFDYNLIDWATDINDVIIQSSKPFENDVVVVLGMGVSGGRFFESNSKFNGVAAVWYWNGCKTAKSNVFGMNLFYDVEWIFTENNEGLDKISGI